MQKIKKINYLIVIFIATLFMGVGYAKVSEVYIEISGTSEAVLQDEVFITDVIYVPNADSETTSSTINYFFGTMLESNIVLEDENSTITYQVFLHNNSQQEYMFIDVITDLTNEELYSNPNIEYSISGLTEYTTTIAPNGDLDFTITFNYKDGADTTIDNLVSKLNFRFLPIPTLNLSNEGTIYTINNIYPGYEQEYQFTVSNYTDDEINNVPMIYSFVSNVDNPITIKIYDKEGIEVSDYRSILGDGVTKETHTYTAKIIWEKDENLNYEEYENKKYNISIALESIPENKKYLAYAIKKEFDVKISSVAPFYFNASSDAETTILNDEAIIEVNVNNYSAEDNFNIFDTEYEISIDANDEFTFDIDGITHDNNVIKISGNSATENIFNLKLNADISNLETIETLDLKVTSKYPYYKEIIIPITIKLQQVIVTLDANCSSISTTTINVYNGKTYSSLTTLSRLGYKFNGWYTELTGGNKITTTSEVTTTGINQTLYAHWEIAPVAINDKPTILMTQDEAKEYYGQIVSTVNGTAFNPNSSDSRVWRVFYIDTENKYGDGQGTIYLKADDVSSKTMRFSTTYDASNTSAFESKFTTLSGTRYYKISGDNVVDSSSNVIDTLYLKLNPTYAAGRKNISSTIFYENEKAAAYLCDHTQFTAYTDSRTNYAVGSPTVEMWIDSWNSVYGDNYRFYYQYNVNVDGTTGAQKLPGYQFNLNNGEWGQAGGVDEIDINSIDTIGMYKTSNGVWFSSPAIVYIGGSLVRLSSAGFIGNSTINTNFAYSPVVSLNSESFVYTTEYVR